MEKNKGNEPFDFTSFQKDQGNFDLKVNINKKRENSINQLLSLIPGNKFINKKRKKNKNKSNYHSNENPSEKENIEQFKKIYEKREHLLYKSFTFKESNSLNPNKNSQINDDKSKNKSNENLNLLEEGKTREIQYALINTNNNKFVPDYEPWDKELLEVIFDNNKDLINKFYSLSDEELNNSIVNKLSKNDEKILDLISYTHHPVPLVNEAKDKDDQINLQLRRFRLLLTSICVKVPDR